MTEIFVVTLGSANRASALQFAFHNIDEAKKFRDYVDSGKGASSQYSTIHLLTIYDKAIQLMKDRE